MSQWNARQFEKDVFEDVGVSQSGDSEVVDLFKYGGASKFSAQAVYDVQTESVKTFDSGGAEVDTATFAAKASTGDGDYLVINDTAGLSWAIAADLTGSSPEPSGAIWAAIPAAQKAQVDLSNVLIVTDADVATAFQDAFNALVDVPFVANDSTATVVFTGDLYGAVTAPDVYNEDDSGAGSISVVVTDAGVASEVDVDEDTVTIPAHGYDTGLKGQLTATGTLPAGLSLITDYWIIKVDANTVQFAESYDDAIAGVPVDITDQGSDENVSTFTATALAGASVGFYKSNDGTNWILIQAATTITVDGSVLITQVDVSYRYFKAIKGLTAGVVDLSCVVLVVGDAI